MSGNTRLWKFWTWEIVLLTALVVLAAGGLLYAPGLADIVRGRRLEAGLCAFLLAVGFTVVSYRLATGSTAGAAQWILRLAGSAALVVFVMLAPVLILREMLKPEYLDSASPFAAMFVLWCLYGVSLLVQWQTRLFYGLMERLRS